MKNMSEQVITKYVVRKPFKYGGKYLEAGTEFVPDGGKWDKQILNAANGLVVAEAKIVKKPAPRRRRRKT
jgi:hypothetical protein